MDYDFSTEKQFSYEGLSVEDSVKHLAKFASGIWQIHPFCEGNTRATAVFMIKYIKTFGFQINNDALECTLEEMAIMKMISTNPLVTQNELVLVTGKSISTVKRIMKSLQEKGYIRRVHGKRYGKWEVLHLK